MASLSTSATSPRLVFSSHNPNPISSDTHSRLSFPAKPIPSVSRCAAMEGDNILESIYSDDDLDVEMLDVEEGELVENIGAGENSSKGLNMINQDSENKDQNQDADIVDQGVQSKNRRRRANKKKNKKRKSGSGPNVMDIDRFVRDTCRQLKEKKSYMVYTAVGCLGVSALSDIVKEVGAIQSCGGQKTADGRRHRTGGGILWSVIKAREPNAYKDIMKKAREFEKQFKQQNVRQVLLQKKESSDGPAAHATEEIIVSFSDSSQLAAPIRQNEQSNAEEAKRVPVRDRIRVPVSYADLVEEGSKDDTYNIAEVCEKVE